MHAIQQTGLSEENISPEMLLRTLAKVRGKRVRRCKLLDANVCHSSTIPDRPSAIDENPPGDLFSLSVLCSRHPRIALKSNREYLAVEVEAEFGFEVFSINRQDRIFQLRAVDSPSHGPLFTRDGFVSPWLRASHVITRIWRIAFNFEVQQRREPPCLPRWFSCVFEINVC